MLSIVIPTKDRGEIFYQTYRKVLSAIDNIAAEIIIVNDSAENSIVIPNKPSNVKILTTGSKGVAFARNLGARTASGSLILFLDDDILIDENNLEDILRLHDQFKDSVFNLLWEYPPELLARIQRTSFGRFLIKHGFTSMKDGLGEAWEERKLFEIETAAGFCMSIPTDIFNLTAGYNEMYPHAGFEDYDFSMKLEELNIKRVVFADSLVYHNEEDRIHLRKWLNREQTGAETRAWGFQLGRHELKLEIPFHKKIAYELLSKLKPALFMIQSKVPNRNWLDPLNHRLIHILLGTTIYQGYRKGLKDARKKLR